MHKEKKGGMIFDKEKLSLLSFKHIRLILLALFCCVFVFSAMKLVVYYTHAAMQYKAIRQLKELMTKSADILPVLEDSDFFTATSSLRPYQSPKILEQYQKLYEKNTDMIGWIKIEDTKINYPVMYTADNFYLSRNFNKKSSKSGLPFIDKRCDIDTFGTNTIIYGHNMKNGTMFADLSKYKNEAYYRAHPIICFDTLYTQQKYEIISVFRSKIYSKEDKVFKHYNLLIADNAKAFDEYIENIKALSLYDIGVSASYGDELVTLVTCAYHTKNGQFVVVAKKI